MIISPYFYCASVKTFAVFFICQFLVICSWIVSLSRTFPGVILNWEAVLFQALPVQEALKSGDRMLRGGVLLMLLQQQQILAVFLKAYFAFTFCVIFFPCLSFGE